jgi:L-lactate dehydrogenase complex protein LldG
MSQSARNSILKKIRMALAHPTPLPFPKSDGSDLPIPPPPEDPVVLFAENFVSLQGKFIFCADEAELRDQLEKLCYQNKWTKLYCSEPRWVPTLPLSLHHNDLETCEAALTTCEYLIARTGSIVLSSVHQGRLPSVFAPVHICIARSSQIVYDIKDGLIGIKDKYRQYLPSLITFATGPSRTADIEKTLVVGVHGPKEVYCFLIDDHVH